MRSRALNLPGPAAPRTPCRPQVAVDVPTPRASYVFDALKGIVRDPCVADPDYEEGVRRAKEVLDADQIREVMGLH